MRGNRSSVKQDGVKTGGSGACWRVGARLEVWETLDHEREGPISALAVLPGRSGESASLITTIKSVQEIVEETVDVFWAEIERLAAMLPGARTRPG